MNSTTTIFRPLVRGDIPLSDPLRQPPDRQRPSLGKTFRRVLLVALALSPLAGSYFLLDEAIQYGEKVGMRASATECRNGGEARPHLQKRLFL